MSIQGHGAQDLGRGHHGVAYIPCRHGQRQGGAGVGWRLVRQSLSTYLHTHLQPYDAFDNDIVVYTATPARAFAGAWCTTRGKSIINSPGFDF